MHVDSPPPCSITCQISVEEENKINTFSVKFEPFTMAEAMNYATVTREEDSDDDILLEDFETDEAQNNKKCQCLTIKSIISHFIAFSLGALLACGYLMTYHGELGYPWHEQQSLHQDQKVSNIL